MKVIEITTEKAIYQVPLEFIAKHRANYYKKEDLESIYQDEIDYVMNDDYEGIDWLSNNMDYEDFEDVVKKVKDLDVEEDWGNAEKTIKEI